MTGSIAAVVFLTLIACLVLTVPIGFSLGIASLGYILYTKQLKFGFIAQNMVTGCDSFPTMAIPFFIFAGELMGGSQRETRLDKLTERMDALHISKDAMYWYVNLRKFGGCTHSGFGMGFERLLIYLTGVDNIRDVIPYARTPMNCEF